MLVAINLDVLLHAPENLHRELGENYRPSPVLEKMVNAGCWARRLARDSIHINDDKAVSHLEREVMLMGNR